MGAGPSRVTVHELELQDDPGLQELFPAGAAGQGLPELAVETGEMRALAVRSQGVPGDGQREDNGLHRRLSRQEPHGVPPLPLVSGLFSRFHFRSNQSCMQII